MNLLKGIFVICISLWNMYMYAFQQSHKSIQEQHLEQVRTWVSSSGIFSDYLRFFSSTMRYIIVLLTAMFILG